MAINILNWKIWQDTTRMALSNRRALVTLSLGFLFYGVILAAGSRTGFPKHMGNGVSFPYLCDKPVGEDGYYMLTIAWNMARGTGIVYNYGQPTTGVQPLSTFAFAGLAWATQWFHGDKQTFIRIILLFGVLTQLLLAHLVGKLAMILAPRQDPVNSLVYMLGFLLTLFDITLFRWTAYGLETGIYLALFAISVLFSLPLSRSAKLSIRQALVFGTLAGFTGLARIDFGIVLFVFFVLSLWRRQLRLGWTVIAGATAASFVAPWMIYIYSVTGGWIPSSGKSQSGLVTASTAPGRALDMIESVIGSVTPWFYSSNTYGASFFHLLMAAVAMATLLAIVSFLMPPRNVYPLISSTMRDTPHMVNWAVSTIVLLLVYFGFFRDTWFYSRYASPVLILAFPLLAVVFAQGLKNSTSVVRTAAIYVMPICFAGWAFLSFHIGHVSCNSISAGFVQNHFSRTRVGMFSSGVAGYFNPNVVNLDGKVDYLACSYKGQNKIERYIDQRKIEVLLDWPDVIYVSMNIDKEWLKEKWKPCDVGGPPGYICFQRIAP